MPYMMSAPGSRHQFVAGRIYNQLSNFLNGKPCRACISPFDIRLFGAGDYDDTIVQPDVFVVCDRSKIDERGVNGAPDLAVEIVSPSSRRMDRMIKLQKYKEAGVREYWIVEPDSRSVQVLTLRDGEYIIAMYEDTASVPVGILEGCEINMTDVFAE